MIKTTLPLAGMIGLFAGAPAWAQSFNDQIIADLESKGYEYIEIENGLTQTKVEALDGASRLEVIYDNTTGSILKQELGQADASELGLEGIEIGNASRDFLDAGGNELDDMSDDASDDASEDDSDDDASDDDSDDGSDDSGGDDGSDDDSSDD
ncbi:PepSY domain-containing protein [Jannaschia ovalis]|uniref:PepSY domain-containing protein n=1 Tax=Jannaschia ovalis TaxID=3038773 RepID=A0ABY8L9I6_9RHOB|nr:PepSY domain-containing protein [Jannaschia sp. GRR-S6-38]WGH77776.1 PepSY domain-containing protein [Jannaschia sp. GRR-S6-38]